MVRLTAAVLAALALSQMDQVHGVQVETKSHNHNALQVSGNQCSGNGNCCLATKCCANKTHACKHKVDKSYAECVERKKCPGKGWKCDKSGMKDDGSDASSDHGSDHSEGSNKTTGSGKHHGRKHKCDKTNWPKPNKDGCFWEDTEIRASHYFGEHDCDTHTDCQKKCEEVEGCETWAWGDWKKCYLKGCQANTDEGFDKVMFLDQSKNGRGRGKFISGPKRCRKHEDGKPEDDDEQSETESTGESDTSADKPCDASCFPKPNKDGCFWEHTEIRASKYFGEVDASSHNECQKHCKNTVGCETWVWGDWKKCYLKGCHANKGEGFSKVMFLDQSRNARNGGGKFISGLKECKSKGNVRGSK